MIDTVANFILGYLALWVLLLGAIGFLIARTLKLEKQLNRLESTDSK